VDKRNDPYHVYIKNRVSMIWHEVPEDRKIKTPEDFLGLPELSYGPYQASMSVPMNQCLEVIIGME
jgi:hypothetical protein